MTDPVEPPAKRKWALWPAALMGLGLQVLVFVTSTLADGGKDLAYWFQYGRPAEIAGHLTGQILALPIICIVAVAIRNLFVRN